MNISELSIKNPIPVIMLFLVSIIAGFYSFYSLKIQNFPDMSLPTVRIMASLPGAGPKQLETEVAKKIEDAIASIQDIKNITTKVQDGSVSIVAEFRLEKSQQEALDDVKSAVSSIRSKLPTDLEDPIITKVTLSNTILTYTVKSSKMDIESLSWFIDNDVAKELLSIKGIGSVTRVGGANREIQVLIDPAKIKALGISISDVSKQLKLQQLETSAGKMEIGVYEQPIRAYANVKKASELNDLDFYSNNKKFKLSDIASIYDTTAKQTSGAYFNGEKAVAFEITRTRGESDVSVAELVNKKLVSIKNAHPDIQIAEAFNFVEPTIDDYHASMELLIEGSVLAVFVVWLFLRNIRATIVTAIALPLSIIPTFLCMYWFGFSINVITLLALSLVVGILVDDAIVEVENIDRHMKHGLSAWDAAIKATQEIGLAVVATTSTLIAVFLPTAFMDGVPGLVFKQFGWTAAISVFASLVVARLLTPLMAAYMMRHDSKDDYKDPFWMNTYLKVAAWCLHNRLKTIVAALFFFGLSLSLIPFMSTGFIPANNTDQTQVTIELEPGVIYATTEALAKKAEVLLKTIPEITNIYTTIGAGSSGTSKEGASISEVRQANLTIRLKPRSERRKKQAIEQNMRKLMTELPGARVKVGSGANGEKYTVALASDDSELLYQSATKIEKEIRTIDGIGNIASTASIQQPEVSMRINYDRAAELGVNTSNIAQVVRIATQGDFNMALSKLNSSTRQIPIVVKLENDFRFSLENLKSIDIPGKNGMVPLSEVAVFDFENGPALINRYNRSQNINIDIELNGTGLGDMARKINELDSVKQLPDSVKILPIGDTERMMELFKGFGLAMFTGILFIYIILVLLFKDFMQPLTILMALPLAIGGAFAGLMITGNSFSMPSLIGLIMLMGIATKNSILLVEYSIIAKRNGVDRVHALLDACHKRARPIIMTTVAMGAGMLPIALQWGVGDGSFRSPMAIAVIGGLITSTFLSLLVIPAVFTYVDDIHIWFMKKFKKQN